MSDKKAFELAVALGIDEEEFYRGIVKTELFVPKEIQDVVATVIEILTSGDDKTVKALIFNIEAFKNSLDRKYEIQEKDQILRQKEKENIALKKDSSSELIRVPPMTTDCLDDAPDAKVVNGNGG